MGGSRLILVLLSNRKGLTSPFIFFIISPIDNPNELEQAVIELHNIARLIEQKIGTGLLSQDLRNCADRLQELIKKV